MHRLVVSVLSEKFGEICARADDDWRYPEIEGSEDAAVRIQRFVACVADEAAGECRQVNVPVVLQHKFWNQQVREGSLVEVVRICKRVVFFRLISRSTWKDTSPRRDAKCFFTVTGSTERLVSELQSEPMKC